MDKAEMKLKDANARIEKLEAIVQDLQDNQSSTSMPSTYIQLTTTTTTTMNSKTATAVLPQCTGILKRRRGS